MAGEGDCAEIVSAAAGTTAAEAITVLREGCLDSAIEKRGSTATPIPLLYYYLFSNVVTMYPLASTFPSIAAMMASRVFAVGSIFPLSAQNSKV